MSASLTSRIISLFLLATLMVRADTDICSYQDDAGFGFLYGSWKDQTTPTPDGVIIGGEANLRGGGGNNLLPALNLSDESTLEITFEILPDNEAQTFNILLRTRTGSGDQDYKSTRYSFYIAYLSTSTTRTMSLPLKPSPDASGENGPVDLTQVDQIQIQGDYANATDAIKLKVIKVVAKS